MKTFKFFPIVFLMICGLSRELHASHIVGSEIRVSHIQNWDYKVQLFLYRDASGIQVPNSHDIDIFERKSALLKSSIIVSKDTAYVTSPATVGCGSPILQVQTHIYSEVISLDPNVFSDLEGYYFVWRECCRNAGVINLINSGSLGASAVTLMPPISNTGGIPIINSSPVLNTPVTDFALNGRIYSQNFGGFDPDGDSLAYRLYRPFIENNPQLGTYTGQFSNGKDPYTQFSPINWVPCYNDSNQINGISNPTCGSLNEPDRLKIDPTTGILSTNPGSPASHYYVIGIRCLEYRNGILIGSVFRDFQLSIKQNNLNPNLAPTVHLPQLQSLASWDGDTMLFTGSPVCVQLGVSDPDPIADIEIEAIYTDYDANDIAFVQDYAVINHPDTFQTALCFQPDSFLPYTTRGDIVALNPGCYDLRGDTLPFYFKFIGYSNAGWGGSKTVPMTSQTGSIDLFTILSNNPLAGGAWYDLGGNNHMNPNGFLEWKYITTPKTYNFIYVQKEPNYPADTAYLTLNFVYPNSIDDLNSKKISVFPNPANFVLTISGNSEKGVFEIFDIQGRKVKSEELNVGNTTINTTELNEGLYFYHFQNQRGKFLIQR